MRISYDFHIHSALSPCGDEEATPCNIVAMASVKGLDAIAISDHNAIGNVKTAMECGEAFGVTVLPAVEVQTAEDIHVLALFPDYEKLEKFFSTLNFPEIENKPDIFGNQYFYDSDNEITGEETRYLLSGATEDIYTVCLRIKEYGGKAVPAHIDREANGILAILGEIPPDLSFDALEFSPYADETIKDKYHIFRRLTDSDAHRPNDISDPVNFLEAEENSVEAVFAAI